MSKPVRAAIGEKWIKCGFCQGDVFRDREVKLETMGWSNEFATALICWDCGQVQMFTNDSLQLFRA
ncbi:hypothetical protein [Streptacidiphilus sp. MAP12-33]|uniref:hypothetical protein n=1 Tax=Streptacidiphilus sp. MAP12-33 TaxID=3156266 RepID=UPI003512364E